MRWGLYCPLSFTLRQAPKKARGSIQVRKGPRRQEKRRFQHCLYAHSPLSSSHSFFFFFFLLGLEQHAGRPFSRETKERRGKERGRLLQLAACRQNKRAGAEKRNGGRKRDRGFLPQDGGSNVATGGKKEAAQIPCPRQSGCCRCKSLAILYAFSPKSRSESQRPWAVACA